MPPAHVVGSVWRIGLPPEQGLLSRRLESAAGGRWYWSPPVCYVAWRYGVLGRMWLQGSLAIVLASVA